MKITPTFLYVFFVFTILVTQNTHANCELSWISDWELGKNWLHTTALRNDHYRENGKFFALPTDEFHYRRIPSAPVNQVVQIENVSEQSLTVLCNYVELSTCPNIVSLEMNGKQCQVDGETLEKIIGIENDPGETASDQYARVKLDNCLAQSFNSDIAILNSSGTLSIPKVSAFKEQPAILSAAAKDIQTSFLTIAELARIDLAYGTSINLSGKTPAIKKVFVHPSQSNIYFAELAVDLDFNNIPGACAVDGKCDENERFTELPIIVAQLKNNDLRLFGHGQHGSCAGGYENYDKSLATHLNLGFGMPSQYMAYDVEHDGVIDYFQITPRTHLPGTKYIYSLINVEKRKAKPSQEERDTYAANRKLIREHEILSKKKSQSLKELKKSFEASKLMGIENKFYFEKEICVGGADMCRPGAGC